MSNTGEYIRLIKVTQDNLENHPSYTEEDLGVFLPIGGKSAFGKVSEFLESLEPQKLYLGNDGEIYPKFKIKYGYFK